jgi:hypothetical protein
MFEGTLDNLRLVKFNARKLIAEFTGQNLQTNQSTPTTLESEVTETTSAETQRRKKKKSKKRVHHFQPAGAAVAEEVDEVDLEQLEIAEREPQKFDVTTDEAILQSGEQASASPVTLNDVCWICNEKWNEFVDLRLVTILPCLHSACSSCLLKLLKTSNEKQKDGMGEFNYKFDCGVCRLELDETIPYEAANQVLNKNLVPSFYQFISTGRTKDERRERRQLVYSLLVDRFEYDVGRVEATLFNFIEIMDCNEPEQLTFG